MKRHSAKGITFPNHYRHDLLEWAIYEQRLSKRAVSLRANIDPRTGTEVFKGRASNQKLWPVATVLGLDWKMLHDMELKKSEFHLAVKNGKGG